jgi:hypothetical protein
MNTDSAQLSRPQLMTRITNLWDAQHTDQKRIDSYGYGGFMKEQVYGEKVS